ncbi:hypothetical protein, partial [Acinetobacter baumannii]|uniref:hypothetical protein n=1 Tax=Acinetobacter baumannii TaxID=470 RepID=UPI001C08E8DE
MGSDGWMASRREREGACGMSGRFENVFDLRGLRQRMEECGSRRIAGRPRGIARGVWPPVAGACPFED